MNTVMDIPRIVIAGTHSGCGKTTVARGVMEALVQRGLVVQPFKVGPDFIDPTYHTLICRRPSRNLDPFMMGRDRLTGSFCNASRGADIAVIEGVMGFFDGIDGTSEASTADVCRILDAPAVLTVDTKGMSRSAHAVAKGFSSFESGITIAGVIYNRVGSDRHRAMIGTTPGLPALGWIPRDSRLVVESRHLGLKMAGEMPPDSGCSIVAESCDIDAIVALARSAPPLHCPETGPEECPKSAVVGVAQDEAFCFYYQDNLDSLRRAGAGIVPFSPIRDRLPDVDAVYIGGGYPELHAEALENSGCRDDLSAAIDDGMPVYGECGGLIYLGRRISAGRDYRTVGALPLDSMMTDRIQGLGYVAGEPIGGPSFVSGAGPIRGHEFHYSKVECGKDARFSVRLSRGKGISGGLDGVFEHNTVGQYTHAYFTEKFSRSFVDAAARYRKT